MSTTTATAEAPAAALEYVDPATLLVDVNVRHDARVDKDFVASIREHGVLVPIVAVRTGEGALRVRYGHRRTLAALEAGRAGVPVVVAADERTDDAAQIERLVGQYAENEHRTGLSTAERIDVAAQLSLLGVSAAQITKRIRMPRAQVDAALTVAGSELAKAATERYDFLTLEQAATVAEFEDDTEAVKALVAAAKSGGRFAHVAQQLRDARAEATRHAELAAALAAAGITVVERPEYGEHTPVTNLSQLCSADGEDLTEENHRDCPGHAAYITQMHGWVDPATGEPVNRRAGIDMSGCEDDETYDEGADEDEGQTESAETPDAAESAAAEPVWGTYLDARYVCTDPARYGHLDRWRSHDSGSERKKVADMSDQEREKARAERRDVIESNKAWGSAETVRRTWLRSFVQRKTAPKGTAGFVATALALDADVVADTDGNHFTAELLGCQATGYGRSQSLAALVSEAAEARAQVLVLAQVLGAYEARTDRNDWRNVRPHTRRYLEFLAEQGYVLANVERRACGLEPIEDQD